MSLFVKKNQFIKKYCIFCVKNKFYNKKYFCPFTKWYTSHLKVELFFLKTLHFYKQLGTFCDKDEFF